MQDLATTTREPWLKVPQPLLGKAGLFALLVLTSLTMPLSLDMYTPAVPHMAQHLRTTEGMVNLTLVGYHFFFAVGLLVFGPLSDRRGRRPVLLGGLLAYAVASAACAMAPSIEVLILARMVQALGAGAADSMTNSVVKDAFAESRRQIALSFIQLMFILGPVFAPIVGAFVVARYSWRTTFEVLTVIGAVCVVLALMFRETLPVQDREQGSARDTFRQFAQVLRVRSFTAFLAIFSLFNLGFMAYISVASFVYERWFGLDEMGYGLFFAATALVTALGPFAWELASRWMSAKRFLWAELVFGLASGACILAVGALYPWTFCLAFLVFAVAEASVRPLTVNILLSQSDRAAGTTSSAINFANTVVGSVGMLLVHLPSPNYVVALGATITLGMLAAVAGWAFLLRSGLVVRGVND